MEKMKLRLTGYFDNNFGDDFLMKIIVKSLPDVDFVIDKCESKTEFLQSEENVKVPIIPLIIIFPFSSKLTPSIRPVLIKSFTSY